MVDLSCMTFSAVYSGKESGSRRPAHHQHSAAESDTPRAMIMFVRVPAPSRSTI